MGNYREIYFLAQYDKLFCRVLQRYDRLISEDDELTLSLLFILEYSENSLGRNLETDVQAYGVSWTFG